MHYYYIYEQLEGEGNTDLEPEPEPTKEETKVDGTTSENSYTDSVVISSHNDIDGQGTTYGASVVVSGQNSYIETPILRLKVITE